VSVRLFVGNLPYGATDADLKEYFGAVGEPSQIIMPVDRETGRPRGFAFVEYADRAIAEEAIRRFDSQPFKGRPLAVSEARPREERGPGSRPPGARPGGPPGSGPRPMRSFDGGGAPGGERGGPPRRESSGPPRRGSKGRKGQWAEEKPKRPIQVRTTGRIYAVDDDDQADDVEIDNFATSLSDDEAQIQVDSDADIDDGPDDAGDEQDESDDE
jgi:RNA recognition motif-containing protein